MSPHTQYVLALAQTYTALARLVQKAQASSPSTASAAPSTWCLPAGSMDHALRFESKNHAQTLDWCTALEPRLVVAPAGELQLRWQAQAPMDSAPATHSTSQLACANPATVSSAPISSGPLATTSDIEQLMAAQRQALYAKRQAGRATRSAFTKIAQGMSFLNRSSGVVLSHVLRVYAFGLFSDTRVPWCNEWRDRCSIFHPSIFILQAAEMRTLPTPRQST